MLAPPEVCVKTCSSSGLPSIMPLTSSPREPNAAPRTTIPAAQPEQRGPLEPGGQPDRAGQPA